MKFIKSSFLTTVLLYGLLIPYSASAGCENKTCPAGQFLFTTTCYSCYPGCYCLGSAKKYCVDPDDELSGGTLANWCKTGAHCTDHYGGWACGHVGRSGDSSEIYRCPSTHPNSGSGAQSINACYAVGGDGKPYYYPNTPPASGGSGSTTRKCEQGFYIEQGQTGCDYCPTGKYCPDYDIEYTVPLGTPQGAKDCPSGYEPNYDDKPPQFYDYCAEDEHKDYPRCQYERGARSCIKKCSVGQVRNDDNECVDKQFYVSAGAYLRKNTTEPTNCDAPNVNSKQYCPGGSFYVQNYDQGKYDCPFNADATSDHKACQLKLTKEQLLNGVTGNGKCWLKTDPDDYKACIYGVRSN